VTIVQNPTLSLEDDVAVTKRSIATQDGPVVLVGYSYGGVVITEAGDDPNVNALVYIAAFVPDAGGSVSSLIANPHPVPRSRQSCRRKTVSCFSIVPWGVNALAGAITEPA
jgi:pimeloyl-ACP methyl ester carboxylesterase